MPFTLRVRFVGFSNRCVRTTHIAYPRVANLLFSVACPCVAMSCASSAPPGLTSSSSKRRQRHKRLAASRSLSTSFSTFIAGSGLDGTADASSGDSSLSSITCVEVTDLTSEGVTVCDSFYMGEYMSDAAVQTDLSTPPRNTLMLRSS